jgi:hypothetical protein
VPLKSGGAEPQVMGFGDDCCGKRGIGSSRQRRGRVVYAADATQEASDKALRLATNREPCQT